MLIFYKRVILKNNLTIIVNSLSVKYGVIMSKHNYTNPAFCQNSEFYPLPTSMTKPFSVANNTSVTVESIQNRSLNLNFNSSATKSKNPRDGPLRIQRSMSTRSFVAQKSNPTTRNDGTQLKQLQQQEHQLRLQYQHLQHQYQQSKSQFPPNTNTINNNSNNNNNNNNIDFDSTALGIETRSGSGRYALVPVEDLSNGGVTNGRYAIVPGLNPTLNRRYAKSQENLENFTVSLPSDPHSFHEEHPERNEFISLPPVFNEDNMRHRSPPPLPPTKIKHAFSSDFGSKSFLIVDKNSNQRYQMVPTAEDEELVDDNQEIIQMHNGRAHRYAVIPTEDDNDEDDNQQLPQVEEEETCLSNTDLNQSQNFMAMNYETSRQPMRTSTPQKGVSMCQLPTNNYGTAPFKNPAATKLLHELLSTPRKPPLVRSVQSTPRKIPIRTANMQNERRVTLNRQHSQSQHQIYYDHAALQTQQLPAQRMHYETIRHAVKIPVAVNNDRTMAVISPRVAGSTVYAEEEDCSSIHGRSQLGNSSYPQKIVNATITLAIISLMLVLGSTMNSGLIIYMIAHFGKSFYLQFSLISAFCGVGLGFLGFRSRQCEWLPNRSYTSGYILVTMFCLLKCCGLLVILVLEPYPGLPLHDVTTGVILGLSTFSMFFIGLGVIGSLWCYRPPPDNRVNVA